MQLFAGLHERTIDSKNRIQLPSELRDAMEVPHGVGAVYVTLGEDRGTLAVYTVDGFETLARRMETEYMAEPESRRFELQFYGLAHRVDVDKQGRLVLPERLRRMARLNKEVYLIGIKHRIEVWDRAMLEQAMEIDWTGGRWPEGWPKYTRMRPRETS